MGKWGGRGGGRGRERGVERREISEMLFTSMYMVCCIHVLNVHGMLYTCIKCTWYAVYMY